MINILWVRLNLVTKANSACSKEYVPTSHDFFLKAGSKACYLNVKSIAQSLFREAYSVFCNEHWEGKLLLFTESIHKENYSYTPQCSLAHTNDNTRVGPTTCKYKCFSIC